MSLLLERVKKHLVGGHDQKTHGRRAGLVVGDALASAVAQSEPDIESNARAEEFLREGLGLDSVMSAPGSVRGRVKDEIATALAERLKNRPEFVSLAESLNTQPVYGARDGGPVYNLTTHLIKGWAHTAMDSDHRSIAVQHAIAEELGLPANERLKELMDSHWSDDYWKERGGALKAFVREMYDHTQEELEKAGIDGVWLYRGVTNTPDNAPSGFGRAELNLQPASAFSTNYRTARDFSDRYSGAIMASWFPRSRILCTARTGMGCLSEAEFIVTSGKTPAWISIPGTEYEKEFLDNLKAWTQRHGESS